MTQLGGKKYLCGLSAKSNKTHTHSIRCQFVFRIRILVDYMDPGHDLDLV